MLCIAMGNGVPCLDDLQGIAHGPCPVKRTAVCAQYTLREL